MNILFTFYLFYQHNETVATNDMDHSVEYESCASMETSTDDETTAIKDMDHSDELISSTSTSTSNDENQVNADYMYSVTTYYFILIGIYIVALF